MNLSKRCLAELIGTFWLVFGGCGSAVIAASVVHKLSTQVTGSPAYANIGISYVGVSLAFGLTVLTMAYAIGHISGCHLNPAVSAGLVAGGRFSIVEFIPYVISQVIGATFGAVILYYIVTGKNSFIMPNPEVVDTSAGFFATNGYGSLSPAGYNLFACALTEFVLTFMFLFIILGSTDSARSRRFGAHRHRLWLDVDPFDWHRRD